MRSWNGSRLVESEGNARVVLQDPASSWEDQYGHVAEFLATRLVGCDLHHVGSTAVPGVPSRPILDLLVVPRQPEAAAEAVDTLSGLGYRRCDGPPGTLDQCFIPDRSVTELRESYGDHVLFVSALPRSEESPHLALRNYFVRNREAAQRYGVLKRALVREFADNPDAYHRGKAGYIESSLAACRSPANRSLTGEESIGRREPMTSTARVSTVDIRIGTVITAEALPRARHPAITMKIDFGSVGLLRSSARVTDRYAPRELLGRQVVAVVNLPPRQIGNVMSQCLVLGAETGAGISLLASDTRVPNGARVH